MSAVPAEADASPPMRLSGCHWQTRWLVIALVFLCAVRASDFAGRLWLQWFPWWLAAILFGVLIQLFFLIYPLWTRSPRSPLNLPSFRQLIRELGIAFCVLLGIYSALLTIGLVAESFGVEDSLTPEPLQHLAQSQQPWLLGFFALLATLVAPICEEVFFRGFLQNAFSARMPVVVATLLQVAIFGAIHSYGLVHSIGAAVMGLVLTAVYRWRKTLVTPMLVHSGANMIAFATIAAIAIAYANSPMLGISGSHEETQLVIREIAPDSAAEKAGLQVGDVVVRFDGNDVHSTPQLAELVRQHEVGEKLPITINRDGVEFQVDVVLQRRGS